MTSKITLSLKVLSLPILILLGLIFFIRSEGFHMPSNQLVLAVTADFILTIPLVYWLLIRKSSIPQFTVFSVFIISLLLAGFIMPIEHQSFLAMFKRVAIPLIELGVLSVVVYKFIQMRKEWKQQEYDDLDFFERITSVCKEILPSPLDILFASEIAVVYYAFNWKPSTKIKDNQFSYFKNNGITTNVVVLVFVLLAETFVLHLILERWSVMAAWIVTALSLYACLQIFAVLRSFKDRLITIDVKARQLKLKYGYACTANVGLDNIEEVVLTKKSLPSDGSVRQFSPFGLLDSHNAIIHLKAEAKMKGFYGIAKKYKSLSIYVDEIENFKEKIDSLIDSKS